MQKPAIPGTNERAFAQSVKETLEIITGRLGTKIVPAKATATTDELAAKINEILALLQD